MIYYRIFIGFLNNIFIHVSVVKRKHIFLFDYSALCYILTDKLSVPLFEFDIKCILEAEIVNIHWNSQYLFIIF